MRYQNRILLLQSVHECTAQGVCDHDTPTFPNQRDGFLKCCHLECWGLGDVPTFATPGDMHFSKGSLLFFMQICADLVKHVSKTRVDDHGIRQSVGLGWGIVDKVPIPECRAIFEATQKACAV